ncbi:MAG: hypothetical protein Athens101410_592 [Parcubacteria group bacterium Athens1014_10]|nr:MAG: hypothetical protein Athens101410_592 [Parcubacteria group bacterium Athens1014_10]TSD04653.1 MAG: hypothetical protein Athens071412_720 [Parcubacteria group bacterium Athens0714_12]
MIGKIVEIIALTLLVNGAVILIALSLIYIIYTYFLKCWLRFWRGNINFWQNWRV